MSAVRDLSGCCSHCKGRGFVHYERDKCHQCEGTGGDPARNYSVFINAVPVQWDGMHFSGVIQVYKAYKSDNKKTVADLERRG